MFPFDSMPKPAQWIGETLPLTHFIRATRGILLRGASPLDHIREMSAMLLFCAAGFITATLLFKKKLG
jgi:ABC-2 type transport system permease protein